MTNVIEVDGLRKSYGSTEVLHGIDFTVVRGRLVGFLGPNGAGKTTTLRILLGLVNPSAGSARLLDRPIGRSARQLRRDLGYLPGETQFYSNRSGRDHLLFFAAVRGCDCRAEIDRLAGVFDLELDKTVRKYSSGMRRKLGLIQALMHRPPLLLLDEPTDALDPLVRRALFDELRSVVAENRTVLFSSHTLGEVAALCDDVVIVREGRIVEQQTIEHFRKSATRRVECLWSDLAGVVELLPSCAHLLARDGRRMSLTWTGSLSELMSWLSQQSLEDLQIGPPSLEELFVTYYQRERD